MGLIIAFGSFIILTFVLTNGYVLTNAYRFGLSKDFDFGFKNGFELINHFDFVFKNRFGFKNCFSFLNILSLGLKIFRFLNNFELRFKNRFGFFNRDPGFIPSHCRSLVVRACASEKGSTVSPWPVWSRRKSENWWRTGSEITGKIRRNYRSVLCFIFRFHLKEIFLIETQAYHFIFQTQNHKKASNKNGKMLRDYRKK